MTDSPEIHPPHKAHGGGVAWLEMVLSIAAIITSAVSVWIAVQHGKVMEKLVAANSMPYLEIVTGNAGGEMDGRDKPSYLNLRNVGVGPARIERLQVDGPDGRHFHTLQEVAQACCTAAEMLALQQSYTTYNVPRRFIPARETDPVFTIRRTANNGAAWAKFDAFRERLHVSACYCSVFDECYRLDGRTGENAPVKQCPADAADDFHALF